ncbi:PEP/pyruvate-binding domain-containing protein, partial [Oceanospirillum sp. HFRX-1_2]
VCYGDILFREKLVEALIDTDADIAVAWDSHWKQRYIGRSEDDLTGSEKVLVQGADVLRSGCDIPDEWASGEFIGLVHFGPRALEALRGLQGHLPKLLEKAHLSGLVEWLRLSGLSVKGVDVSGDWAEVNQPKDIAHFVLGTKAETLARLRKMVKAATIQDQVSFTTADWSEDAAAILRQAEDKFSGRSVVVRSSARSEDAFTHSNAGAYTSVLNVAVPAGLGAAIEEVIASYHNM